mmetsp:Transcript_15409/g.22652  ORF Transcript_15409/g.22652 Transcript_15409/m.22652 type:complete len:84 (-) Transcript_15409:370-621(-)
MCQMKGHEFLYKPEGALQKDFQSLHKTRSNSNLFSKFLHYILLAQILKSVITFRKFYPVSLLVMVRNETISLAKLGSRKDSNR